MPFSTPPKCRAEAVRALSKNRGLVRSRMASVMSEVEMWTGHGTWQRPSEQHDSGPGQRYWRRSSLSSGIRAITRRAWMRWRGVMVMSRVGQTCSQAPHSMHLSAMGTPNSCPNSVISFMGLMKQSGSSLTRTPGLRTFCGSARCFSSFISAYMSSPHSRATKGAMARPVPCSPFSEPSSDST